MVTLIRYDKTVAQMSDTLHYTTVQSITVLSKSPKNHINYYNNKQNHFF